MLHPKVPLFRRYKACHASRERPGAPVLAFESDTLIHLGLSHSSCLLSVECFGQVT